MADKVTDEAGKTTTTPQLDNLIEEAKKKNALISTTPDGTIKEISLGPTTPITPFPPVENPKVKDDIKNVLEGALLGIHIGEKLLNREADIRAIFRNHGMDTMSQNKAWDELMSILTLEK